MENALAATGRTEDVDLVGSASSKSNACLAVYVKKNNFEYLFRL